MVKRLRYFLQGIFVKSAYWCFDKLSVETASGIGGLIGRTMGPFLSRSQVARKNLQRAMPDLDDKQVNKIIKDMWENLGRVFCEFPHMGKIDQDRFHHYVTVTGGEHITAAKQGATGSLFFSGHFANWELAPKTLAMHDCPLALLYRKGNNPIIDKVIQQTRDHYQSEAVPKGSTGSRQLVRALKEKRHVGLLLDQKVNTGIPVKFFGRDAMTSEVIAILALKFKAPIIPTKVVRTKGFHHEVTILPPINIERTDDQEKDVATIMATINGMMESWIRENPAQWIWIHNRWPKENT